VLCWKWSF